MGKTTYQKVADKLRITNRLNASVIGFVFGVIVILVIEHLVLRI
jgi:hypothetical protein